jgi:hypothetical protein
MELNEAKAVVVIARHKEERSSEDGGGASSARLSKASMLSARTCDAEDEGGE